jgi:hypothetical protein
VGQLRANSMQFICDLYAHSRHIYLNGDTSRWSGAKFA